MNLTFDPVLAGAYLLAGVVCAQWILRASWQLGGVWPLRLPWHVKAVFPLASFFRAEYDDPTYGTVFWNRGEVGTLVGVAVVTLAWPLRIGGSLGGWVLIGLASLVRLMLQRV